VFLVMFSVLRRRAIVYGRDVARLGLDVRAYFRKPSREAATHGSPGRQPWSGVPQTVESPGGTFRLAYPGLTPWATLFRPLRGLSPKETFKSRKSPVSSDVFTIYPHESGVASCRSFIRSVAVFIGIGSVQNGTRKQAKNMIGHRSIDSPLGPTSRAFSAKAREQWNSR